MNETTYIHCFYPHSPPFLGSTSLAWDTVEPLTFLSSSELESSKNLESLHSCLPLAAVWLSVVLVTQDQPQFKRIQKNVLEIIHDFNLLAIPNSMIQSCSPVPCQQCSHATSDMNLHFVQGVHPIYATHHLSQLMSQLSDQLTGYWDVCVQVTLVFLINGPKKQK